MPSAENRRYYVFKIFYNKDAQAEDRPVNKGFDSKDDALKEFHSYLASNIKAETCGWVIAMVIDDLGTIIQRERWSLPESELYPSEEPSE